MPAMVVRHGDDTAGAIFLKINQFEGGCMLYERTTGYDGNLAWRRALGDAPKPEADVDAYIAKQVSFDPDIWVVEVESRTGETLLDDPIL